MQWPLEQQLQKRVFMSIHTRSHCCMCAMFFTMPLYKYWVQFESASPETQSQMPKVTMLIHHSVHDHKLECLTNNVDEVSHPGFSSIISYVLGTILDVVDKANGTSTIPTFKEEKWDQNVSLSFSVLFFFIPYHIEIQWFRNTEGKKCNSHRNGFWMPSGISIPAC